MINRYEVSGSQGEFQPGSDGQVLKNKPGITSPDEMDDVELLLLEKLYQRLFVLAFPAGQLSVEDLKDWHYQWLGNVYDWAGEERSVNLAKGDFHFAAAMQIHRLLQEFERDCLVRYTPCNKLDKGELIKAIAVTHVELILIHPFRDGNGRLARLLADVMAAQAGCELLDYTQWDSEKPRYFAAIQQGLAGNYEPMTTLVDGALTS